MLGIVDACSFCSQSNHCSFRLYGWNDGFCLLSQRSLFAVFLVWVLLFALFVRAVWKPPSSSVKRLFVRCNLVISNVQDGIDPVEMRVHYCIDRQAYH